jgi:hypothetical protein
MVETLVAEWSGEHLHGLLGQVVRTLILGKSRSFL